jgi:hypothetical protein
MPRPHCATAACPRARPLPVELQLERHVPPCIEMHARFGLGDIDRDENAGATPLPCPCPLAIAGEEPAQGTEQVRAKASALRIRTRHDTVFDQMQKEALRQVFRRSRFESLPADAGVDRRPVATAKYFECGTRVRLGARRNHVSPTGFGKPGTCWRATPFVTHGAILGRPGRFQHTVRRGISARQEGFLNRTLVRSRVAAAPGVRRTQRLEPDCGPPYHCRLARE